MPPRSPESPTEHQLLAGYRNILGMPSVKPPVALGREQLVLFSRCGTDWIWVRGDRAVHERKAADRIICLVDEDTWATIPLAKRLAAKEAAIVVKIEQDLKRAAANFARRREIERALDREEAEEAEELGDDSD